MDNKSGWRLFRVGLLLFLFSCATQKEINTIEKFHAKVTEFEKHNLFENDQFKTLLLKNWKTYVEPSSQEQIRNSPTNQRGKIDQNQYLWITVFKSDHPSLILERNQKMDDNSFLIPNYTRHNYTIEEGKDSLGSYLRTEFQLKPKYAGDLYTVRH